MPYPNEHAGRLRDPALFVPDTFRRTSRKSGGRTYHVIIARLKGETGTAEQSLRYPIAEWTVAEARVHAKAHGVKRVEAASARVAASRRPMVLYPAPDEGGFVAASGVKVTDDQQRQRFRKKAIRTGDFIKTETGQRLEVTPARIAAWHTTFDKMRKNGVDVEVTLDHPPDPKHRAKTYKRHVGASAADTLGYVEGLAFEDDTLICFPEIRGDKALDLVRTNRNVSVVVDPNFTDGEGNEYGEAIIQIGVCQAPVVPGQGEFEPIAASLGSGKDSRVADVFIASTFGEIVMDFSAIKKLLGTEDEITEDNLHDILEAHLDTAGKKMATMAKSHKETVGKLTAMSQKVAELEKGEPKIDPDTLDLMSDAVDAKAETLVAASRITPGVRDKLLPFLRGMPDARPVLMLSRKRAGTEKAPAIHILEVLAENDVVKLGEQTNAQVTAMSRQTPDDNKADGFDEATNKEMLEMVGVTG